MPVRLLKMLTLVTALSCIIVVGCAQDQKAIDKKNASEVGSAGLNGAVPVAVDRTTTVKSIAEVTQRYEALKKLEGTTPAPAGKALERGAALMKSNAVIPILYPVKIEIDGDTRDWESIPFTGTLSVNCESFPPPTSAADARVTFKIAATDKMLALLILVHDDKLVFGASSAVYQNDAIEVFLDPLFSRSDRHDDTSMQLFITYKDQTMKDIVASGRIPLIAKPVAVEGGWGVEVGIPLDNRIFQLHPFDGLPIGINISYNDNDTGKGREKKITWSALDSGDFSWMRTDVFGAGVFVGDIAMPVVPPTPSEAVMKAKRLRAPVESFTDVAVLERERPNPSVVRGFQSGGCSPELFSEMKKWGANVVRVQMQGLKSYSSLKDKSELMKEENMKAYLDELEGIVKDARTAGMKLLLANHGVVRPPNITGNIADSANNINQKMYEFWDHPELEKMFCFFWKSVAERLLPYRDTVWAYDLMNEPYDPNQMPYGPKQWPPLAVKGIKAIRSVDKDVWIDYEVGPGGMPSGFRDLMPLPDPHIIYDFHMYMPHAFTHQGLQGYGDEGYGSEEKKVRYPGMIGGIPFDKDYLRKCMQPAIDFQKKWRAPINIGEFSAIAWAPPESTSAYLADIISIFEENGWSWEYHAYAEFQGWSLLHEDGFYWRHWKNEQPRPAKKETLRGKVIREALKKNSAGAADMPDPGKSIPSEAKAGTAGWSSADEDVWEKRIMAAGGVMPSSQEKISNEKMRISSEAPNAWGAKTRLKGMKRLAPGSLEPDSVEIRFGGRNFAIGTDVLLDLVWGGLGLAPGGVLNPQDEVEVSYRLSSRRVDALVRDREGRERVRPGTPHLINPPLPSICDGDTLLARVFVDYHSDGSVFDVLPLMADASKAPTSTTGPEKIPATVKKMTDGKAVKIICWGDSVTEGGDVGPGERYGDQLAARLKAKYPAATVQVMAVGGSQSLQWLPDPSPAQPHHRRDETRFQRILDAKPDLVVVEFVNDQWLSKAAALLHYRTKIIAPLRAIGTEVLLLTPQRNWERKGSFRDPDTREYVAALREIGRNDEGVGVADMAGRWEHLWCEGIPFPVYLANGFNHPDVRGHLLFTEEICRALGMDK
ncbi:MAG: cellulase family glycosylhydrolase [Victivallales bacterium]